MNLRLLGRHVNLSTRCLQHCVRIGGLAAIALCAAATHSQSALIAPTAMGESTELLNAVESATATAAAQATNVIEGLELRVWAPPGLVSNPVTLDFDPQGRAYVVSSARSGLLLDIRQHSDWVPEVHTLTSTEDLRDFFRRLMAPELSNVNQWLPDYNEDGSRDYNDLLVVAERVFRVEDTDGDGVANLSTVVHEGFNDDIASDVAGGILVYGDELYVTAAPDLWLLRDADDDGLYEFKTSISHGYSVHPAFAGHDMSALARGPDGRIYWKIGDIGLNVTDDTGRDWVLPNTGAVLRAEPDGSDFEVFAWGLRNTQEIAFDKYGNLISVDNDGDHPGETERVVYLVQGSDAGWRSTWQYGKYTDPKNNRYNVWMEENLFRPRFDGQAAYITPPIAPHRAGPSGVDYNPGTALGERWENHFFMTSFTGGAANASVYAFELEPDGAGFTLSGDTQVVRGLLSAGSAFGPDGALYLTDWVRGYSATGEGQLWRLDVPGGAEREVRREVANLIATDFSSLRRRELAELLSHSDMRIRQKAQFELVAREDAATLRSVAGAHENQLARVHAIWGLGQLARQDIAHTETIRELLDDDDSEIRAQAAKNLGDVRDETATERLIDALSDSAPRVRLFAAEALGRIGDDEAIGPIAAMLAANNDEDAYLRTAGVHALASIGNGDAIAGLADHQSSAVRLAAVVALRRLEHAGAAEFVNDSDAMVATEAARAINDEGGIVEALPALADALDGPVRDEAFVRRAISANLRVGNADAVQRIEALAADSEAAEAMRIEALATLAVWPEPSTLDRVDGAWIGQLGNRDSVTARLAVERLLPLLDDASTTSGIRVAMLQAAVALNADQTTQYALRRLQLDADPEVRVAALSALMARDDGELESALSLALSDTDPEVRMAAIRGIPVMDIRPEISVAELTSVTNAVELSDGERQSAMTTLGTLDARTVVPALSDFLDRLQTGDIPPAIRLELLEAVIATGDEGLLERIEIAGFGRDLGQLAVTLPSAVEYGGSARTGRQIAVQHPAAQCTRCHIIGDGESTIGPNLNGIGSRLSRAEILESLIDPSGTIAEGYDDVIGASAMPPMGALLTPREIRDLVEFLSSEP